MTDINQLWGKAKAADAPTGFRPHPIGTFQGHIVDIVEREFEGKAIYELIIETEHGKAKHSLWDLGPDDLEQLGEEKFMVQLARRKRLVVDLGQPEPKDHDEWLGALGQTVGSACTLVVVASTKKEGQVVTYLNAPESKPEASKATPAKKGGLRKPGY